jgi:peroxiredoxin Q/BCP
MVQVGQVLPNFQMPGTSGLDFDLLQWRGKKVVLYFYPKDNTPGCTQEGHEFTALYSQFKKANTEVFGVSRDSVRSHEGFKEKQKYKIDLLSDGDEKICRLLGVMQPKSLYGRKYFGVERSTFVINERGELVKEWRKVKVSGHAQEVLEFVQGL